MAKGWRAVFFIGIVPALFTLLIRRGVAEPEVWKQTASATFIGAKSGFRRIFQRDLRPITIAVTARMPATLFACGGVSASMGAGMHLSLPRNRGGVGLSVHAMSVTVIVMQAGMWFGYVSFGFLSDYFGRKRCYIAYLFMAALLVFLYGHVRTPWLFSLFGAGDGVFRDRLLLRLRHSDGGNL